MIHFKAIFDITPDEWRRALQLSTDEIPDAVIVEGSWWRERRNRWRLPFLEDVRELPFPDIFWGRWKGKRVIYSCAYGAPRTAEIIHLFGALGARLAIQLGTCGGLQSHLQPGDVMLPAAAICQEGTARLYGAHDVALPDKAWNDLAKSFLTTVGVHVVQGTHLTWPTLFAESGSMVAAWHEAGYLTVDMETATTLSVARHFNMAALSLLVVWDDLTRGRHFLEPLQPEEKAAVDSSNRTIFEIALRLVETL